MTIDRHFVIDEIVLKQITGDAGATWLKEAFEAQCLPNPERSRPEEASAKAEQLLSSPAAKWANSKLRGELESAKMMLSRLAAKEPIAPSGARSGWLHDFLSKMGVFLRVELPGSGENGEIEMKYGTAALQWLWDDVIKKPQSTMQDFEEISVWSHLLNSAQLEVLREKRGDVLTKAKATMASSKRKDEGDRARGKKAKKPKRDAEAELDATTRALLGMS